MLKTTLMTLAITFFVAHFIVAAITADRYKDLYTPDISFYGRRLSLRGLSKKIAVCEDEHEKKRMIQCKKLHITALTLLYLGLAIVAFTSFGPKLFRIII